MNTSQLKMTDDVQNRRCPGVAQRPTTLQLDVNNKPPGFDIPKINLPGKRKKVRATDARVKRFSDLYVTTGESLGEGSFGHVNTYRNVNTNKEFAVKIIKKTESKTRHRVLKEIEIFHHCQGHDNILQMVEYFEEDDKFYLVFEKMEGGTLLDCILNRGHLSEREASRVVCDIASGLEFLHKKGIAHRDLKPENILCAKAGQLTPVKICDFDLGSAIQIGNGLSAPVTTPELLSPVGSADFMAPEVVDVWQYQAWSYDKRCDLWSLGIIIYILLCGYRPFYAHCNSNCDFDNGGDCDDCQELLFKCIRQGMYSFPDPDWSDISHDAKNLIQHLLVRNPHQRYTAEQVQRHPWLSKGQTATTPLATPFMLSRNNTVRELSTFTETANAVNRMIQQHLSMNEISSTGKSSSFVEESEVHSKVETESDQYESDASPNAGTPQIEQRGMIHTGDVILDIEGFSDDEDDGRRRNSLRLSEDEGGMSDCSAEDLLEYTRSSLSALKTSDSQLISKRQAFQTKHLSECSVDSGNVSISSTPPDY